MPMPRTSGVPRFQQNNDDSGSDFPTHRPPSFLLNALPAIVAWGLRHVTNG